jgi:hypothetical protein
MMMGVETPIPPGAMNVAAPDGAPPRRFSDNYPAPPCLEEALKRGIIVTPDFVTDFHASSLNLHSCAFLQSTKKENYLNASPLRKAIIDSVS